ncbi:hypothetical protein [Novosphingopyxis sp.]|uniref:hypothetical protein n=1 Tax=Novosphingopyxis sp. TaxID=2709690 RepID=UPI003B5A1709
MQGRRAYSVWLGSALLTITALFHFTGYFEIPAPQPGLGSPSFFDATLKPLWIFASLHWLLTAAICLLIARGEPSVAQIILLVCAGVLILDAILLYIFIGPFIGEALLTAAALMFVVGAYKVHAGVKTERF